MRIVTVAFLMAAMLAVGRAAVAQDAPAPTPPPTATPDDDPSRVVPLMPLTPGGGVVAPESRKPVELPRLDPKRGDKAFAAALSEVQHLQADGEFLRAYGKYLLLKAERPDDPDTLWGIGECGTASAGLLGDPDKQRERLTDAKAAYTRYTEVEKRPKYAKIAVAKARVALLEGQIATIVVPAVSDPSGVATVAPPDSPTPGIPGVEGTGDLAPTVAPAPEPALIGPPGVAVVPQDHTAAASRVPIVVSTSDAAAGNPTTQSAGAAPQQRRAITHEDHLKCLTAKGIVIAQIVSVGGKLVMQLRPPENWRTIPCEAKARK